jgi:hypothetical protein
MKKILFMAAAFCISHTISAQNLDTIPHKSDTAMQKMKPDPKGYYITLQAGQVMLVKDGKGQKLDADKLLKDGTIVTTDGKVKKTDGTTIVMKEGDRVYLEGGMSMGSKDQKD